MAGFITAKECAVETLKDLGNLVETNGHIIHTFVEWFIKLVLFY